MFNLISTKIVLICIKSKGSSKAKYSGENWLMICVFTNPQWIKNIPSTTEPTPGQIKE